MGTVHVVATPIGNLEDITLRALRTLREADLVLAEDTRRTRQLLEHHGIRARLISLHSHNEVDRIAKVLDALADDGRVALVSDAGTPLVSDPGAALVAAAADAGHAIEPIPGPSAVLAALAASGLHVEAFLFLGFLPRKRGARLKLLEAQRGRPEALVIFESPHRVAGTLDDLIAVFGGERRAAIGRELTKLHEEVLRLPLAALRERFGEGARGEFTLVVEGGTDMEEPSTEAEVDLEDRIRGMVREGKRPREIAAILAPGSGLPRREIYGRALRLRAESGEA